MRLDEYDQPTHAYCQECGKECRPEKRDYGYEPGHHIWVWESRCCNAAVGDCPPEEQEDADQEKSGII